MAKGCSHEDSRLSCIECDSPICSSCLVQCPVGFRCKSCVKPKNTKLSSQPWAVVVKGLLASVLVGFAAGWLIPHVGIPYVSCFICFFLGIYSGRWLSQFIDRRLGSRASHTVVFGVLIGMVLSPLSVLPVIILELLGMPLAGHHTSMFESLNGVLSVLFDPVCFFAGVLRPTIWGEF